MPASYARAVPQELTSRFPARYYSDRGSQSRLIVKESDTCWLLRGPGNPQGIRRSLAVRRLQATCRTSHSVAGVQSCISSSPLLWAGALVASFGRECLSAQILVAGNSRSNATRVGVFAGLTGQLKSPRKISKISLSLRMARTHVDPSANSRRAGRTGR